jgi:hypothetical protein
VTTTAVPAPVPIEIGALFARSWELFKRNWIVSLPPIVAGFLAMIIIAAFAVAVIVGALAIRGGNLVSSGLAGLAIVGCLVLVVLVLLGLWSQTAMYAMAGATWSRESTNFDDGFAAFRSRSGALFAAWIGIIGLALLAFILLLPTLGLSIIALSFVTMYVLPAAIVGRRGGFEAIGESFSLIRRFFVPSLVTWLALYAIQYALSFLMFGAILPLNSSIVPTGSQTALQFPPIPMLMFGGFSYAISVIALLAYIGFSAIVQVGLYRDLIAQPDSAPPARPAPSPMPPAV